jgi:hypothetical protein
VGMAKALVGDNRGKQKAWKWAGPPLEPSGGGHGTSVSRAKATYPAYWVPDVLAMFRSFEMAAIRPNGAVHDPDQPPPGKFISTLIPYLLTASRFL